MTEVWTTPHRTAPVDAVVALPGSKVRYTTIQNWSNDVYNLVTKRAHAYENSTVEWIDANTGSKKTVKFPAIYLRGEVDGLALPPGQGAVGDLAHPRLDEVVAAEVGGQAVRLLPQELEADQ